MLQVLQGELLHLVGCIAALKVVAQAVALNGVGQNDGGAVFGLHCTLESGVDLAVIVATALELPNFLVGHVLDELLCLLVAVEEELAHVGTVVGAEGLEITIMRGVHQVDQGAVLVLFEQLIPFAAPDDLDHRPACSAEEGLQFLNDLGVATHRAVKALQVAVDHKRQVVQVVQGSHLD